MNQGTTVPDSKGRVEGHEYGVQSAVRYEESLHRRALQSNLDHDTTLVRQVNEGLELRLALYEGTDALLKLAKEMVKR